MKTTAKKTRAAFVAVMMVMTVLGAGLAMTVAAPTASAHSTGDGTVAEKQAVDAQIRAFKQQHGCTNLVPQNFTTALRWYSRACNSLGVPATVKCKWFSAGTYTYQGFLCYGVPLDGAQI